MVLSARRNDNALRVFPRGHQVDGLPRASSGVKSLTVVLDLDNFPPMFGMRRISHAQNQLCGSASFGELKPEISL